MRVGTERSLPPRRALLAGALTLAAGAALPLAAGTPAAGAASTPEAGSPVSVTLSAPPSVPAGETAFLGVAVSTKDTGDRVAGVTVVLQHRWAGTRRWFPAAQAVTDIRGHVVFAAPVTADKDFRARTRASAAFAPGRSGVLRVMATR